MSILNFPDITPNAAEFGLQSNTQNMRSELDGTVQTLALPGDIWTGVLTFSNKFDPEARILRAFISSLRGQSGRFYLKPPRYVKAGIGTGTPLVKGASQVGSSVIIDGCTPSVTGWLLAGDYFQIGDEVKMLTADANTDGGGQTTLNFVPPIRTSPADNSNVEVNSPKFVAMLKDPNQAKWQIQPTPIYALSLAFDEALS